MHKNDAMQMRRPGPDVPRGCSGSWQQAVKHSIKSAGRDGGGAVEGKAAAALLDKRNSLDLRTDAGRLALSKLVHHLRLHACLFHGTSARHAAWAASSITGQWTCAGLSELARPAQAQGWSASLSFTISISGDWPSFP